MEVVVESNQSFDRKEAVVLVQVNFNVSSFIFEEHLKELEDLAYSAGGQTTSIITASRDKPDPKYFIGKGKLIEIQHAILNTHADLVLFNHELSPSQQRNLESFLQCRVLDRTGLILDIFASRARTSEGKLQVELAQLQHLSTRLVRGWTHLERQKGGIGLRGPGEKQLETDRRLIRERIKSIKQRLEKVRQHRNLSRVRRKRHTTPSVALVGYTNAGKSTLFNQLTKSDVYSADQLFATLDPTLRHLKLPHGAGIVVLIDTVGFIRDLPHDLIEAFKATLEEAGDADLLLHVVDAADSARLEKITEVDHVLEQIGASHIKTLMVFNKIDLIEDLKPHVSQDEISGLKKVWVSSKNEAGFDLLKEALGQSLEIQITHCCIKLAPKEGALRANLYENNYILNEIITDQGEFILELKIPARLLKHLTSININ